MTRAIDRTTDAAFDEYQQNRIARWDTVADSPVRGNWSGYYRSRIAEIFKLLVFPGQTVVEIGSGTGDLLAALQPSRGVGIDFSPRMVAEASRRHPALEFVVADAHDMSLEGTFEVVILSDLINDVWDVQAVLEQVHRLCTPRTRVILNSYNKIWQGPLGLVRSLGLANPLGHQNWLSKQDVRNLLRLSGFEVISESSEVLLPVRVPLLNGLFNKLIVKLWPARYAALAEFVVARPQPSSTRASQKEPSVSVIVAARNEAGHIEDIVARTPQMGSRTELIFVEGHSTDDTYAEIERVIAENPDRNMMLLRQPGTGKGDAVRHGYDHATGDILMILDADMTVAPEDLPRFYQVIVDGTGEFVNGVRLVYPMEREAMQFLNLLGNKFFGLVFSWLLRQPVKDTLCGTKVLTREAYETIAANRSYFGDFDPFGDFDLLFGAAKINLKIIDVPVRYRDRAYGDTNIDRWRHGVLLLRMAAFAAKKLRFV